MKNFMMARGAEKIVTTCVKVQPGEEVLIITEVEKFSIAESLAAAAYAKGGHVIISVIEPRMQDSAEPPHAIAAAMKQSDIFICVVGKSITHTHAVKDAITNGSRGVVLTQFSENMLVHGGIECDFEHAKLECKAVTAAMAGAKDLLLTSPGGTHLRYSAEGRRGNSLYCMVEKGELTVEQGKALNEELKHNIKKTVKENVNVSVKPTSPEELDELLEKMTPEQIEALKERLNAMEGEQSETEQQPDEEL